MALTEKSTAQDIKNTNKKSILSCIRSFSPISRAEISQKLKISKPTVSAIVEELLEEEWVHETGIGTAQKKGGRKPIQIKFNIRAGYVIGVDIGGTKVMAAISDLSGQIITFESFATGQHLQAGLLERLKLMVDEMVERCGIDRSKILGMGIGVPGITNVSAGSVIDAPSLNWVNYPLKEKAQELFELPIYIDNDVNVSVLGEQWLGAARNKTNVLLIAIGTGVGCGILLNGKLFRGASWAAGEIGYMVTNKNEAQKRETPPFRGFGFLDSHVGGPSITQRMLQELEGHPEHSLNSERNTMTAKDVFAAAINHDELALKVVDDSIEHLSFAIANAASLFNPEIILLGGGISKSGYWFLPKVKETVADYVPFETNIALTDLGDQVGVVGAISLFLREHESVLKI